MKTATLNPVLLGALAMASGVSGLFFLRFWRTSRERLFVFFALAFWLLGLNWLSLALVRLERESQHEIYLLRLVAFGLIIVGVVDKNRRARLAAPTTDQEASLS
ncbi:MAG TPA: DUF5985 family protein [Myxococcaceae bacterium]|nr:DUF5985 family protein [Myxococcaceae bacterium]